MQGGSLWTGLGALDQPHAVGKGLDFFQAEPGSCGTGRALRGASFFGLQRLAVEGADIQHRGSVEVACIHHLRDALQGGEDADNAYKGPYVS